MVSSGVKILLRTSVSPRSALNSLVFLNFETKGNDELSNFGQKVFKIFDMNIKFKIQKMFLNKQSSNEKHLTKFFIRPLHKTSLILIKLYIFNNLIFNTRCLSPIIIVLRNGMTSIFNNPNKNLVLSNFSSLFCCLLSVPLYVLFCVCSVLYD